MIESENKNKWIKSDVYAYIKQVKSIAAYSNIIIPYKYARNNYKINRLLWVLINNLEVFIWCIFCIYIMFLFNGSAYSVYFIENNDYSLLSNTCYFLLCITYVLRE